jgi:hypothetical protein
MSIKVSETSKRPRRLKIPIEPIHVEELLAGAGMSGFLGVLDPPVLTTQLEKLAGEVDLLCTNSRGDPKTPKIDGDIGGLNAQASEMSARVASVVLKVEALTELMNATAKNCSGKTKMDDGGKKTK